MAVTNWENLAKNGMNPQTIPAFVDEKIGEHNADATAHLASEASLAAHRASVVCDHLAESVVNDKLERKTRYYNAIVDPSDDESFDTLQGALDYCEAHGFGQIYIVAGTHYFSTNLYIDPRITLVGDGIDETIILPATNGDLEIQIYNTTDSEPESKYRPTIRDLTFGSQTNKWYADQLDIDISADFINVHFAGMSDYIYWGVFSEKGSVRFESCRFTFESTSATWLCYRANYSNCLFLALSNTAGCLDIIDSYVENCLFMGEGSVDKVDWIHSADYSSVLNNNRFYDCGETLSLGDLTNDPKQLIITNNYFEMASTSRIDLNTDKVIFANNKVKHATGNTLRIMSGCVKARVYANETTQAITDSGTSTQQSMNVTT